MLMTEELPKRLWRARKNKNMSREQLARKIEISANSLYNYERGAQVPTANVLKKIAAALNVSTDYLLGNTDDPTPPKKIEISDKINIQENLVIMKGRVPILGRVAAGKPVPAIQEALGWLEIPEPYKKLGIDFALMIDGNSMSPKLNKGDLALVHMQATAENGDIVIVIVNGNDGICKQFFKKESAVVLHSFNPEYDDIIIPAEQWDEECHIVGVVVARFESMKKAP